MQNANSNDDRKKFMFQLAVEAENELKLAQFKLKMANKNCEATKLK
ncbi:MAG: hypothetical protein PHH36_07430 [Sideroxydans sp.]|nr:hypothetical protein [Sideroxydans sp.]